LYFCFEKQHESGIKQQVKDDYVIPIPFF
jgi:hypothetical protein